MTRALRSPTHALLALTLAAIICMGCGRHARYPAAFDSGLPEAPATEQIHKLERQMAVRVNRDRAKHGLPNLAFDARLCDIARSHSLDMRDNHFFEHESPRFGLLAERLERAGYIFLVSRENLAEAVTVDEAQAGLLESPHHYENLMATDITHVAVGIAKGGVVDPSNLTVTQIFTTPGKKEALAEAKLSVEGKLRRTLSAPGQGAAERHSRLDQLAREQLAMHSDDLSASALEDIGSAVGAQLVKAPISGTNGIAVSAQLIIDSSQFSLEVTRLAAKVRYYGLAIDRSRPGPDVPRLRVLVLFGLR